MKKFLLLYLAVLSWQAVFSQWSTSGSNIYNSNSGNVGIGTGSPGAKLEINTTTLGDGLMLRYNGSSFVNLHAPSIQATWFNPITLTGDGGFIYGGSNIDVAIPGFVIAPWSATGSGIRLDQYGNVGIKTNNTQGYQLAVNGGAIFTSARIRSYANWPDYVFKTDYTLRPLDSLFDYIKTNHHLPDMPSADSVQAAGIDLGVTEAALLKKIEELTLYVIEQKKQLEAQQAMITRLEQRMDQKPKN